MRSDILDIKNEKRIAVMGGTFDPIHYGHLVTAEAVRQAYNVTKVIFIPTGKPLYKSSQLVSHTEHRYLMSILATVTNPYFSVSRMEIDRQVATYTIDTIKELREICGAETKIYFITGADAIYQILSWKDAETLLTLCSFIAVTRPGYNKDKLKEEVLKIKTKFESKLHFLEVPALAISSTDIRNRSRLGKTIKYLLPEEVEKYIEKHGLYKEIPVPKLKTDEIRGKLEAELTEERFVHTLGVLSTAQKLAETYGAELNKVEIAALLHDCAKEFSDEEIKKICKENNIKLDESMKKRPNLAHCLAGSIIAKNEYGVSDEEILNAVKYHTTGAKNMTLTEKIICLADYIEPNRKTINGLEHIRELAFKDLDKALALSIRNTIEYNKSKKRLIHPWSYEALEFLEKNNI